MISSLSKTSNDAMHSQKLKNEPLNLINTYGLDQQQLIMPQYNRSKKSSINQAQALDARIKRHP